MKRIREYLNEKVFLPRKVIIFFIVFIVLTASILFGRMYIQKNWEKRLFLGHTASALSDMESCIKKLLEPDISIEEAEDYCMYLLKAVTEHETTMEAGYLFVSNQITSSWLQAGFDGVSRVILGSPQYNLKPLADGGISQNERLFLQELLTVVEKLHEPYRRCSDGTATAASSLRVFLRSYQSFALDWQIESHRTSSGVSPFDLLKEPE